MFRNKFIVLLITMLCLSSLIFAGCGSCQVDINASAEKTNSSSLITSVPKDGKIEGLVIASCGKCNFGSRKERSCSLSIKIGDDIYPVNKDINDFGDMHAKEGFCMAIRVAYVSGEIKKNHFTPEIFLLIESPKI